MTLLRLMHFCRHIMFLGIFVLFVTGCAEKMDYDRHEIVPVKTTEYRLRHPLTISDYIERKKIFNGEDAYTPRPGQEFSRDQAERLFSVLDVDFGSASIVPHWERLPFGEADIRGLRGFSLASSADMERDHSNANSCILQRFEVHSDDGESLSVQVFYTESAEQAKSQLLNFYASTSIGVGQRFWRLAPIRSGPGETCLLNLNIKFVPEPRPWGRPTEVSLSDSSVLFFRQGTVVEVGNQGHIDVSQSKPRVYSAMPLASLLDEVLVRKLSEEEERKGTEEEEETGEAVNQPSSQ